MTPAEAVVMDWLLERGYTREQAARALVALTMPEPGDAQHLKWHPDGLRHTLGMWLQVEAQLRGYLPREGT